jgi:hypothetical protein
MTEGDFLSLRDSVKAYFYYLDSDFPETSEYAWAYLEVNEVVFDKPEVCWDLILALINAAPSRGSLLNLGAGHLEDIIKLHGNKILDRIKHEAYANRRLRAALSVTRVNKDYESYSKFAALQEELDVNFPARVDNDLAEEIFQIQSE